MKTFDEEKIRFRFGERWQVDKWDRSSVYTSGIGLLSGELTEKKDGAARSEGTKAVDFVGMLDGEKLYLIEVKDFRGHHVENRERQVSELPLEIGLKVRDTLAGLVGAYSRKGGPDWIERCGQVLALRTHQVHVVAWIADEGVRPAEPHRKRAVHESVRLAKMKQKLAWLTSRVWVENPLDSSVPDVIAENLKGAGQR